ncbi:MAG TPA: methyltransferase domain-containing protein [Solirubrobacteraceae bacterium]|jgi:SAM-dependent methyltransferase|nr:methyltransferase domain-containing protein [Solirubrobacteraceae bacterium]
MPDTLLRAFGWRPLLIHGDPCVLDRWIWLRRHLRKGEARTFDAGCGNGAFSIYAARCGNRVLAASFSAREQEDARRRAGVVGVPEIEFRTLDLRELEEHRESLGRFDQIICCETIEHLVDDRRLVRTLVEMLEPGGQLLLTTPFDSHRPLYREDPHPSPTEDGSHVRYGYSREQLSQLAREAGLEVTGEAFISGVVSQKLTDLMRRLTARLGGVLGWAIVLPLRPLVIFDAPLSRMLHYPHLSVALCGVKPS